MLAERNAQIIGPLFESCPFCGTKESRLEDHIVGHLRSLALKSLPPCQDDGLEDSKSEKGSLGLSEPASRSTIKMDSQRYIKPVFIDAGEQPSFQSYGNGNTPALSPYIIWGGYRNYVSQFAAGYNPSLGIRLLTQPLLPPPLIPVPDDISDNIQDEVGQRQEFLKDPSSEFVEDSLLDEAPDTNRRIWEWGFAIETYESSYGFEGDVIINSFLEHTRRSLSQESMPQTQADHISTLATSSMTDERANVCWESGNDTLNSSPKVGNNGQ